jgi:integrase
MPRQMHKLTALQVNKVTKPGLYGDGGGLTLQVTKAGVKSWLFRYMREGKAHGMGLGPIHTVSLAEARQKALEARRQLLEGNNPLLLKRQQRDAAALERARAMTFDQCAEAYIKAHRASWKNAKHADQWTNTLTTYASPVFGHLPVADIDTTLVVRCLASIWDTKTETATRLRGRIEAVLGWATTSGLRAGDNPARWRGHLENLLATINKTARTKNHPSLPWQRLPEFMQALRARPGASARALEFAILTACRSGEVRGAKWSEIDLAAAQWTIPAERMKAGREHEVPLSTQAVTLLRSLQGVQAQAELQTSGGAKRLADLVFPGTQGQTLSDMSLTAVIRRMNEPNVQAIWVDASGQVITAHGFRATFRMWTAEETAFPREVAEHALAHQLPDAVERAYQRGTQFLKRRALMQDWAEHCLPAQGEEPR